MSLLAAIFFFLAGFVICIQIIGMLFSVIDLWYAIGSYWRLSLRRILVWVIPTCIVIYLLGNGHRTFFIYGLIAGVVSQVLNYLANIVLYKLMSRNTGK